MGCFATIRTEEMTKSLLALAALAATVLPATAQQPSYPGLPGVRVQEPVATREASRAPVGEPEERRPVTSRPGTYRIGNWDVHVSGYVAVQTGFTTRKDD